MVRLGLILSLLCACGWAQVSEKHILARLQSDEAKLVACERKAEEAAAISGAKRVRISNHCFGGCPRHMPKPFYPEWARRNRWAGSVVVDAIANDEGKVVSAEVTEGPGVFHQSALLAAAR